MKGMEGKVLRQSPENRITGRSWRKKQSASYTLARKWPKRRGEAAGRGRIDLRTLESQGSEVYRSFFKEQCVFVWRRSFVLEHRGCEEQCFLQKMFFCSVFFIIVEEMWGAWLVDDKFKYWVAELLNVTKYWASSLSSFQKNIPRFLNWNKTLCCFKFCKQNFFATLRLLVN